ncbi:MAG TPA: DUF29 family protein [Acetobacteraceae bacterium]
MSDYDSDILAWSERQSALLHRLADGERLNDTDLDWPNIAEEIAAVGRSERAALSSHIANVIEHLIKLETSPAVEPRAGWEPQPVPRRRDCPTMAARAAPCRGSAQTARTGTVDRHPVGHVQ